MPLLISDVVFDHCSVSRSISGCCLSSPILRLSCLSVSDGETWLQIFVLDL